MKEPWPTVLWIAAPFALAAVGLWVASRFRDDYWASFDLVIYAALAAGAGVVAGAGYLAWYVLRTGPGTASVLPALTVVLVVGAGAAWWLRGRAGDGACARDHAFYRELAAAPAGERAATLAGAGAVLTDPGPCALEGLTTWFGPDPAPAGPEPMDEAQRLRALAQLLDGGLPASEAVLGALARLHDVAGVRLVMERRPGEPFPAGLFREVALGLRCVEGDGDRAAPPTPSERADREVLAAMLEVGSPAEDALDERVRERLRCLGLRAD